MATIIHDPTRGWLLLTPDGQIEIAKEDWDAVVKSIPDDQLSFYGTSPIQDHHPYSVDAKFEVVQFDPYPFPDGIMQYRKIARLVKAKEQSEQEKLADIPWKPESQDDLWGELGLECTDPDGFLDIDLARKSFRIERI